MSDTATSTRNPNIENTRLQEDYERDGYIVVPGLFSRQECAELKKEGLRILNAYGRPGATVLVGAAVYSDIKYFKDHRLVDILSALMPEGVMFMSDKFVFKSGEMRFATPWHQDAAYWPNTRPKLSVWIALDDVKRQNGALKVMPGAHRSALAHGEGSPVTGVDFTNVIRDLPMDAPGEVVAEMAMGDALFFSDLLPHASCPNESGEDRYALISTYHAPAEDDFFDVNFAAREVLVPGPASN